MRASVVAASAHRFDGPESSRSPARTRESRRFSGKIRPEKLPSFRKKKPGRVLRPGDADDASKGDEKILPDDVASGPVSLGGVRWARNSTMQNWITVKRHKFIFNPSSTLGITWDIVIAILILFSCLFIPFEVSFPDAIGGEGDFWEDLLFIVDTLFILDIVITFNKAIPNESRVLIYDRKRIANAYLKGWFIIDVISSFPWGSLFTGSRVTTVKLLRMLRMARLLKVLRVLKMIKIAKQFEERFMLNPAIVRIFKFICQIIYTGHFLSCAWHFIGSEYLEASPETGWVHYNNLQNADVSVRYIYSVYWVMATMSAVGYGDYYAIAPIEKVFSMITQLVGASIFGYIIGNLSSLIGDIDRKTTLSNIKTAQVNAYVKDRALPKPLQLKVREFYAHYLSKISLGDESRILSELSMNLRSSVACEIYGETLFKIQIFSLCDPYFAITLTTFLRPLYVLPDEVIAQQNTIAYDMFFLYSGIVEVSYCHKDYGEIMIEALSSETYFGELGLLYSCLREYTYTAKVDCELFTLTNTDLDALFDDFPEAEAVFTKSLDEKEEKYREVKTAAEDRYQTYLNIRTPYNNAHVLCDQLPPFQVLFDGKSRRLELISLSVLKHLRRTMGNENVTMYDSSSGKQRCENFLNMDLQMESTIKAKVGKGVIDPNQQWKVLWDLYIGILILFSVIVEPLRVSFDLDKSLLNMVQVAVDACFGLDIVFNFFTAYTDSYGQFICNVRQISLHYLRGWFLLDFFSTAPVSVMIQAIFNDKSLSLKQLKLLRMTRFARLLKLTRLLKMNKSFRLVQDMFTLHPLHVHLTKLFTMIAFIAHISGCAFYLIGSVCTDFGYESWIQSHDVAPDSTISEKYLTSTYWAFTTMITVGYGDVVPKNVWEVGYASAAMFIGASVFGYVVGSMAAIINKIHEHSNRKDQWLQDVKEYMKDRKISKDLSKRVLQYYEYYLASKEKTDDNEIIFSLSDSLRMDIRRHVNKHIVKKLTFFEKNDDIFISYIMTVLIPEYCIYGDYVFLEGDIGRHMHFLVKGTMEIVKDDSDGDEIVIQTLLEGSFFGEIAMIMLARRSASVRAVSLCQYYSLSRSGMAELSNNYPEVAKRITEKIQSQYAVQQKREGQDDIKLLTDPNLGAQDSHAVSAVLSQVDDIVEKLTDLYGGNDKGKSRALSTIAKHLKKSNMDSSNANEQFQQAIRKIEITNRMLGRGNRDESGRDMRTIRDLQSISHMARLQRQDSNSKESLVGSAIKE